MEVASRPVGGMLGVAASQARVSWVLGARFRKKNALNSRSERLGSPPPELPNHEWIVRPLPLGVNVTLVISAFVSSNHGRLTSVTKGRIRVSSGIYATWLIAGEKTHQTRIRGCRRLPSL